MVEINEAVSKLNLADLSIDEFTFPSGAYQDDNNDGLDAFLKGAGVDNDNILSSIHLANAADLKPSTDRIGKGSGVSTRLIRKVKYPWMWIFNKLSSSKSEPVDGVKIISKFLPTFYIIPNPSITPVLPFIRRHMIRLKNGPHVIALKDIMGCQDSRNWYEGQKKTFKQDMPQLKYTKEIIEELDKLSEQCFGQSLRAHWDSCIMKAEEELKFQLMVRQ